MGEHKYIALANRLRADILGGVYRDGQRLPSENRLTRELGLSRQTVRRALAIIEEEGLARRRRGSGTFANLPHARTKSGNIAVITTYIADYIFPRVLSGIEKTLAEHQYAAIIASTRNQVTNERRLLQEFLEKNVDGFIIEGTKTALPNPNIDLYHRIREAGLPIVFINGVYPELGDAVSVLSDDRQGGYDACRFLIGKGHRRIAGIFKGDDAQGLGRYAGMIAALIESGLTIRDEDILWFTTADHERYDFDLAAIRDCTAVVCYNDMVAISLQERLREAGLRVPEDMAVISFDNSALAEVAKITSLDYPKDRFGQLAAEKLLHMLAGGEERSARMAWGFAEREST